MRKTDPCPPRPAAFLGRAALATALGSIALAAVAPGGADGPTTPRAAAPEPGERVVSFGRDIRPLLSDRCFQCHGPDEATREAGLRLDGFEGATRDRDGSVAIVPGDPDASELLDRVTSTRPGHVMPPPDSGKRALDADEQALMRQWIAEGAVYEEHWAFQAPARPAVPEAAGGDWALNPIDRFVARRLAAEGLEPSGRGAPVELLRRAFLELTGLPPTLREVEAFEADLAEGASPDGVLDRWIERLTSEEPYVARYAERMTRPWLDQARYADTSGIHTDAGRQAWAWRDWVLAAYRDNKPFDEFVVEQLAGDLLPEPTTDQLVATGFHRNHVTTDEGGAINEEYLVEYAVDRTKTTGAVFLGLTVGCAQCHDHKFDPISMEEYYGLFAFFDSNDEPGLYSQARNNPMRALEPFLDVPTAEQTERLAAIEAEEQQIAAELERWTPEEETAWAATRDELAALVDWADAPLVEAASEAGATLDVQSDGSVVASGENPADDAYVLRLRTDATDLRAVLLEALPADGADGDGPIGRAPNGNAVIRSVVVEAVSVQDPEERHEVPLAWAFADFEQSDQDFSVTNVLERDDPHWWALGGHLRPGPRAALLLAAEPFGYEGGTELVVRVDSASRWSQHTLARPRLSFGAVADEALALLPTAFGRFHRAGPFPFDDVAAGYETARAPERATRVHVGAAAAAAGDDAEAPPWEWEFQSSFVDEAVFDVPTGGRDVNVLAREVFAPSARTLELSLGSDDGFVLGLNGERLVERRVDRGPAADQDRATLELPQGRGVLFHSIVNTGGPSGAYFRALEGDEVLPPALVPLLYPERARAGDFEDVARAAWHRERSPRVAEIEARLVALGAERTALESAVPRAMVMRELAEPRPTYVLMRGAYDHPDTSRVVERDVPAVLGGLPDDLPRNRLGLARWLVSEDNPLTARVTVNRLWAEVFGTGIVTTTDDFGYQGAWPSHPELLDWLAVELVESGWDVRHVLRLILGSATWRQASAMSPALAELDPEDRLLGRYPRKRLSAEAIRDSALYGAGLLVERLGGPSVKPYQPEGLWREVAMVQSNTRIFERGEGEDLWRRSLYTYWKRAAPPPSLLTFDAPTREFCIVERSVTDTPLQALVLMNDEQFVEAARMLAQRTLAELPPDDPAATNEARLERMFRRVLARAPEPDEAALLLDAHADFRWRFNARGNDARMLLEPGEASVLAEIAPAELAAWTLTASALLNLYETTNPR